MTADNRPVQRDTEGQPLKYISQTRLYKIWHGIHRRCYEPKHKAYHDYGGRGITVCPEWYMDNLQGFYNFREWAIQSGYQEDLTIDRIDPNGNYEPSNCRWISIKKQQRNRRDNRPVVVNGVEYSTVSEACEDLHRMEDYHTIQGRIREYGYTPDKAFSEPIGQYKNKPITVNGIEYHSIKECCEALQLNYNAINVYKRRHNLTWEEAIKYYIITKEDIMEVYNESV